MFNERQNLCLLISTLGLATPIKQFQLLNLFGAPQELWANIESGSKRIKALIGENNYTRLRYSMREDFCGDLLYDLKKNNITPVTYYCDTYPALLKNIYDPPLTLFCMGNTQLLNSRCISVVGTRKMSAYGKKATQYFVSQLAKYYTVVSGLAYGVDTCAHEATLAAGGKTIAVLGSGLLNIYPASNAGLAENIVCGGGLIVSEYQSRTQPNQYNFPMRNRIISGLSEGVLITEAPQKSGVMSTYEYAAEQGRDVYVVPGEIFDFNYKGSNFLLKENRNAFVTSPTDIIEEDVRLQREVKRVEIQLDIEEQSVVDLLEQGRMGFDDIARGTNLKASQLNYCLATLELKGIILKMPGNIYSLIDLEEQTL